MRRRKGSYRPAIADYRLAYLEEWSREYGEPVGIILGRIIDHARYIDRHTSRSVFGLPRPTKSKIQRSGIEPPAEGGEA